MGRIDEAMAPGAKHDLSNGVSAYDLAKIYVVPTPLSRNWSGISKENWFVAVHPVQCIGTTISGAIFFISLIVGSMIGANTEPVR